MYQLWPIPFVFLGCIAVLPILLLRSHYQRSVDDVGGTVPSHLVRRRRCSDDAEEGGLRDRRHAFVTMAYDDPDGADHGAHVWPVLPLAYALQRLGSTPLVVLTNTTRFAGGFDVASVLCQLNAYVLPVHDVPVIGLSTAGRERKPDWQIAFLKLQIWRLTKFDRLVWLDSDAVVTRSLEHLFQLPGVWAQRNDYECTMEPVAHVCSGLMVFEPSEADYHGLLATEAALPVEVRDHRNFNDQVVIERYFRDVVGDPIRLLDTEEALFGHCLLEFEQARGTAAITLSPMVHKLGMTTQDVGTNYPAYVHMTLGFWNRECFTLDAVHDPVCRFHKLGQHWRRLLCEAVKEAEVLITGAGPQQSDLGSWRAIELCSVWHGDMELSAEEISALWWLWFAQESAMHTAGNNTAAS